MSTTGQQEKPACDEFARISISRQIIRDRVAAGLSQAELARRAGVRVETLNRLEKGKHMPNQRTFDRIDAALKKAEASSSKPTRRVS